MSISKASPCRIHGELSATSPLANLRQLEHSTTSHDELFAHWVYQDSMEAPTQIALATERRRSFTRSSKPAPSEPSTSSITVICDIADSFVDQFLALLGCGGLDHINEVYRICTNFSHIQVLSGKFDSGFIHRENQLVTRYLIPDYARAVQSRTHQVG